MTRDEQVREFAATHGGVVTAPVLDELGFTTNQLRNKVRRHGWKSIGRGAYRLFPIRDHRDSLLTAITVLERAVVSHESAAEIHDIPRLPKGRSVVTVHSRTTHQFKFEEVLAHRSHDIDESHIVRVGLVPVTTVERTVIDIAAGRHPKHIGAIVDDLVSRGALDFSLMADIAQSVARKGKPGTVTMRTVIEARGGEMRPQSELERRARDLIATAGLPMPIHEYPIPWALGRRFDDAYPEQRLAIEWDSRRYHGQLEAFEADRLRDRTAALHGWRVIRFTWQDVEQRPAMVVESIRLLLAQAG
ncbi:MAG: hypothetical protein WEA76_05775 [Acidimicrobiia bacterium]